MENKSQLGLYNTWGNWSGGFQELLYNTKITWNEETLEGPSEVRRLKIMARWISFLEGILFPSHLASSRTAQIFPICGMLEENPEELLLQSELIPPTSGTPERCLVTIDSLCN